MLGAVCECVGGEAGMVYPCVYQGSAQKNPSGHFNQGGTEYRELGALKIIGRANIVRFNLTNTELTTVALQLLTPFFERQV